jgi:hypothetical protein
LGPLFWLAKKTFVGALLIPKDAKIVRAVTLFVKGKKRVIPRILLFFGLQSTTFYFSKFSGNSLTGKKKECLSAPL